MWKTVATFAITLGIGVVVGAIGAGADAGIRTFEPGTPIVAADVNANFSALVDALATKQARVSDTCPPGSAIRAVDVDGGVTCEAVTEAHGRIDAASRVIVQRTNVVPAGLIGSSALYADCDQGYVATGGGAFVSGLVPESEIAWLTTRPNTSIPQNPRRWEGAVHWTRTQDVPRDVFVYAVCVRTM